MFRFVDLLGNLGKMPLLTSLPGKLKIRVNDDEFDFSIYGYLTKGYSTCSRYMFIFFHIGKMHTLNSVSWF